MKKIFTLGMVLVLTLVCLCGCGSNKTEETEVALSPEEIIIRYNEIKYDKHYAAVVITDSGSGNGDRSGIDYVSYIAYDKNGLLANVGGLDLSYANYIINSRNS